MSLFPKDNRQSLVLVKLEEVEERRMSKEMKYLVSSLTYLPWPQNGKATIRIMINDSPDDHKDFCRKSVCLKITNSWSS